MVGVAAAEPMAVAPLSADDTIDEEMLTATVLEPAWETVLPVQAATVKAAAASQSKQTAHEGQVIPGSSSWVPYR